MTLIVHKNHAVNHAVNPGEYQGGLVLPSRSPFSVPFVGYLCVTWFVAPIIARPRSFIACPSLSSTPIIISSASSPAVCCSGQACLDSLQHPLPVVFCEAFPPLVCTRKVCLEYRSFLPRSVPGERRAVPSLLETASLSWSLRKSIHPRRGVSSLLQPALSATGRDHASLCIILDDDNDGSSTDRICNQKADGY